jgi:hypothetical protein
MNSGAMIPAWARTAIAQYAAQGREPKNKHAIVAARLSASQNGAK